MHRTKTQCKYRMEEISGVPYNTCIKELIAILVVNRIVDEMDLFLRSLQSEIVSVCFLILCLTVFCRPSK